MSARLATALREHFTRFRFAGSPWIFHHRTTRRHYTAGARIASLHRAVQTAARQAKLPTGWRVYDLRHRRITLWRLEGKPDAVVAAAVGHASLAMTRHYTHVERQHVRVLVEETPTPKAAAQAR
jgi:integrase